MMRWQGKRQPWQVVSFLHSPSAGQPQGIREMQKVVNLVNQFILYFPQPVLIIDQKFRRFAQDFMAIIWFFSYLSEAESTFVLIHRLFVVWGTSGLGASSKFHNNWKVTLRVIAILLSLEKHFWSRSEPLLCRRSSLQRVVLFCVQCSSQCGFAFNQAFQLYYWFSAVGNKVCCTNRLSTNWFIFSCSNCSLDVREG